MLQIQKGKDSMVKNFKKVFNIGFNSILLAFGLYFFLVQHNIAPGGVLEFL